MSEGGCSLSAQLPPQSIASPASSGWAGHGAGKIRFGGTGGGKGGLLGTTWLQSDPKLGSSISLPQTAGLCYLGCAWLQGGWAEDAAGCFHLSLVCPVPTPCLLDLSRDSPVLSSTFSTASQLSLQLDVPCAGGSTGSCLAQLSLPPPTVPLVRFPAISQPFLSPQPPATPACRPPSKPR